MRDVTPAMSLKQDTELVLTPLEAAIIDLKDPESASGQRISVHVMAASASGPYVVHFRANPTYLTGRGRSGNRRQRSFGLLGEPHGVSGVQFLPKLANLFERCLEV